MTKRIISFAVVTILLLVAIFFSATTGSVSMGLGEFIRALFGEQNADFAVIKDLRFPRIIIAIFAGAALSVAGALLQAVMRNPLADAGVIGISAGAGFMSMFIITFLPTLFFFTPLFAFIGGALACFLVFVLSWKSGLEPMRLILVGIAISAVFTGLREAFIMICGYMNVTIDGSFTSNMTMKTWTEVEIMVLYGTVGLVLAVLLVKWCNLLTLDDKTVRSLGFPLLTARIVIAAVAVLLSAIATAVAGVISFVGLLIPHIARRLVGNDYKYVIPFSMLAGALLILIADTLGRTLVAPQEIPASTLMAIIGGPFLIFLLRRGDRAK